MANQILAAFGAERIPLNAADGPRAQVIGFGKLFQTEIHDAQFQIQFGRKVGRGGLAGQRYFLQDAHVDFIEVRVVRELIEPLFQPKYLCLCLPQVVFQDHVIGLEGIALRLNRRQLLKQFRRKRNVFEEIREPAHRFSRASNLRDKT